MTKNISQITILSLLAAALVTIPMLSRAEGTNAPAVSNQTAQPKTQET